MTRRTSRTKFKDALTDHERRDLVEACSELHNKLVSAGRGLHYGRVDFERLDALRASLVRYQEYYTGNPHFFYEGRWFKR